jgi:ubiquinone/menaquinone biosynthesis C-methylase UbiE
LREPSTLKETWEKLHKSGYKSFSEMILYKHLIKDFIQYFKHDDFVLDIGCGTGDVFNWMQDYIGSYYGLDISKNVCEKFIKRFLNNPKVFYASECSGNGSIPIKDLYFDKVFSCLVFQHIHPKHIQKYFKESYRLLKDDGLFMFHTTEWAHAGVVDSRHFLEHDMSEETQDNYVKGGIFCHREEFIIDSLNKANFELVETSSNSDVAELIKEKATWKFYVAKKKG